VTAATDLEALAVEASTCTRCALAEGRTQVVFGTGDPHADVVFVGEAPGAEEDSQGQLDLIEPRVVVTLGNFATKLLLGTKLGITKLRGRSYPWRNAVLVPTYHPAAVLRGGGAPMAQMRADLVRAKQAAGGAPPTDTGVPS